MHPRALCLDYALRRRRERAERLLASVSAAGEKRFEGRVLVDAMWDNPNYWIRYALFRSALGLSAAEEIGVLGQYRAAACRKTLERFGIAKVVQMLDLRGDLEKHRREAVRLLARTKVPEDILDWRLPYDLPPDFVYDGILKRQRAACVDLRDTQLPEYIAEALWSIAAAEALLNAHEFDLVLLSHAVNFQFAALAWLAVRRRIPVVLLYGNYGVARFVALVESGDLYDTTDRPSAAELATLPDSRAEAMAAAGRAYLRKRRGGETDDIGARYAFQAAAERVTRAVLGERFRWDPDHPVIVVYASNWFDFPHVCGMTHFRDFLDWIQATLGIALRHRRVNWLFKAHPCDRWYGGVTLLDLLPPLDGNGHVRLVPTDWDASALLDAVDGVITYHGTVGIEAAAAGKPVLVADRGWYHDAGFVKWPRSRDEYLDALATDWWEELDLDATTHRAQVFAGWYFGHPAWQGGFVLEDDSVQWPIYARVPRFFADNPEPLRREVDTIRAWFHSDSRHYHTFKMRHSEEFCS